MSDDKTPPPAGRDYGRAAISIAISALVGFATGATIHWLVHFK